MKLINKLGGKMKIINCIYLNINIFIFLIEKDIISTKVQLLSSPKLQLNKYLL